MNIDLTAPPSLSLDSEEACAEYLYQLKWPNGFVCSACSHRHAYQITTRRLPLFECANCGHQASLIAGTVMEGTRTPLTKWFLAIKLISNPCRGISAFALSQIIAVTYKTAWTMLHKLRFVMGKFEADTPLTGNVTINDAWYGRPYNPSLYRHPQETPVLIGATMSDNEHKRITIHMLPLKHISDKVILPVGTHDFIKKYVSPSASIREIQTKRYTPKKLKKVQPLFRHTCAWMNSTFHGIGRKHLQAYFNEYCCRTNLQLSSRPIFEGISELCTKYGSITYAALILRAFYSGIL